MDVPHVKLPKPKIVARFLPTPDVGYAHGSEFTLCG